MTFLESASLPAWLIAAIFFAAVLSSVSQGRGAGALRWILPAVPLLGFISLLIAAIRLDGEVASYSLSWAPQIGLNWDIWVSPVGLLLGLLVTGIGTLIVIYTGGYLGDEKKRASFLGILFVFMAAMLGVAFTEHLLVFFVFWELTSLASYLLIGFYKEKEESRKSALDAMLITVGGGVALLAGILLLGEAGGSYRISELIENRDTIISSSLYPLIFVCVFLGAATKSAQFPFHFWLPGAMAAPAPVSAYLHSATMVKVGVFLLMLMHPLLGETALWHFTLLGFGTVTMLWGALVAMVQKDLKRLLAFSTVSALGTLVMLLGIENKLAAKTIVIFLIVHALYKGALFMVAGILEKSTGTRDVAQLRGLFKAMPVLAVAAGLAAFSMSGLPPFIGFIAKELLYEVKLEIPIVGWAVLIAGFLANAANIVVAGKVGIAPFLKSREGNLESIKRPGFALVLGPAILGVGSLLLGIFPGLILGDGVAAAASQIKMSPVDVKLKLWHGINLVLLLSVLTVATGVVGFLLRERLWGFGSWVSRRFGWSGKGVFRSALYGFIRISGKLTDRVQSGNLRQYFATIFVAALAMLSAAWAAVGRDVPWEIGGEPFRPELIVVVGLLAIVLGFLSREQGRMTAILLLGVVGFGIAAIFGLLGAPDLAITQILVETLTLVLFALAVYRLPTNQKTGAHRWPWRVGAALLAGFVGLLFAMLTLKALHLEVALPVSAELAALSVPEAYGRNVVNVILVDFRALDTLGEICVLVIAALGVVAMLGRSGRSGIISKTPVSRSAVLEASARFTAPIMIVFSIYLLLKGHNEPGGGFIGGLVLAMAVVLQHLADPSRKLSILTLSPTGLCVVGLLLAIASGLPGFLTDGVFLKALWGGEVTLPPVGKLKFGTPLIFDIGVFVVVAGIVLLLYGAMAGVKERNGGLRSSVDSPLA
ncbi:MAG: hydrogen gas-evolving membrane-bound hydrogenase subunit E [Verrucomicrobiota bacterium]